MRQYLFLFICLSKFSNAQLSPNKAFDTLTESIKATSYERGQKNPMIADHHYCTADNKEFTSFLRSSKSFWPARFDQDPLSKKMQLKFDHIKFAKKGYLPVLFKVDRPVYKKSITIYLERLVKDSVYEMENIFFNPDLTVDEKASSKYLSMYQQYLIKNQLKIVFEINDIRSPNVKTDEDKKIAANNLKKLLGCNYCVNVNIQSEGKEINNMVVFKVIKL
jgi:hypothetical protein